MAKPVGLPDGSVDSKIISALLANGKLGELLEQLRPGFPLTVTRVTDELLPARVSQVPGRTK
jgi:hypothetical protein